MNLHQGLSRRAEEGHPVRVGMIGAGKFGTMFLSQVLFTPGIHVVGIADLAPDKVVPRVMRGGWTAERLGAKSLDEALATGATCVTDDAEGLIMFGPLDIVIDGTGDPSAGIHHCHLAFANGKHVIMVNVEADAVAGPLLARQAEKAGVCYSMAWGDQPALICEHVDWARACGFEVVCAGKGTRYLPEMHASTPDTVWNYHQINEEMAIRGGLNPKMFNSFVDGTKSGIEMTAVCNATGLTPQPDGLGFPPCSRFDLSSVCRPKTDGGILSHKGTTEVVASLNRDGSEVPHHLMMGTYVVIEAGHDYARECFEQYYTLPDETFQYATLYRPVHLIGQELGISVANIAVRGEPTGAPIGWFSDVVATAKRDLKKGEVLDGEGGYCVWGKQTPTSVSLENNGLPLGLAANIALKRDIPRGAQLSWDDVDYDPKDNAIKIRREMEKEFAGSV